MVPDLIVLVDPEVANGEPAALVVQPGLDGAWRLSPTRCWPLCKPRCQPGAAGAAGCGPMRHSPPRDWRAHWYFASESIIASTSARLAVTGSAMFDSSCLG